MFPDGSEFPVHEGEPAQAPAPLTAAEGESALVEIQRTLSLIEVNLGAPIGWRLRQLVAAIELFTYGRFGSAYELALRARAPLDRIEPHQRNIACALPLGVIRNEVRKLHDVFIRHFGHPCTPLPV